ncbi:hypothetical protein B0I31_114144 [Saccharothrix carnea]|uniref:Uncharacterized protein n=1 Tax=Saccharothrix carnea TaxID=1280637 RepID=A0A2P8I1H0_SACCR|nr:hypothetical protein B0I31_114144 [Saccharothrix carnea]
MNTSPSRLRRALTTATDHQRIEAYRRVVDSCRGPLADGMSTDWIDTAREFHHRHLREVQNGRGCSSDGDAAGLEGVLGTGGGHHGLVATVNHAEVGQQGEVVQ